MIYAVSGVIAEDDDYDLVQLSIDIPLRFVKPAKIASGSLKAGERVLVLGSPLGLEQTVSEGIVAAVRASGDVVQITAPISPGSSGSPVVNMKGEVVGVATLTLVKGTEFNFAISTGRLDKMTPRGVSLSDWNRKNLKRKLSVAIPRLKQFAGDIRLGEALRETLLGDMRRWGWVDILPESLYLEDPQVAGTAFGTFDFANWVRIDADRLVKGVLHLQSGELMVELRLYHVPEQREIVGKRYTIARVMNLQNDLARMAYTFADEIVFQLTGQRGNFLAEYCSGPRMACP
jgi:hypothetical protein